MAVHVLRTTYPVYVGLQRTESLAALKCALAKPKLGLAARAAGGLCRPLAVGLHERQEAWLNDAPRVSSLLLGRPLHTHFDVLHVFFVYFDKVFSGAQLPGRSLGILARYERDTVSSCLGK